MAWPQTAIVTDEPVTTVGLNALPILVAQLTIDSDAYTSVVFSALPQHFAHLVVDVYARSTYAADTDTVCVRFNGDSGSNYDFQYLRGVAGAVSAGEAFGQTLCGVVAVPGNTAGANLYGGGTFCVPHYANAANQKAIAVENDFKYGTATGNMHTYYGAGFWRDTDPIDAVTFTLTSSQNFKTGSRLSLYGLP